MKNKALLEKIRVLTAGLLVLAYGCSVGPNYQKPDLRVPSTWNEARQDGVETRSAELTRWWTAFNDPLLNSLVQRAIQSNLDLRFAEARIREARASRAVTAAGEWPAVDVSSSYKRIRSSENAFAVSPQGGGGPSSFPGSNLDQNFYQAGFDASWEINVFGSVRRSEQPADATIEANVENRRDVLVTLLGDVARNYVDVRGFQSRLEVARANLKSQQDTL